MPPRPSRNLDRALLAAGAALYPATGSAGLTIRQVAEAAGVNIGMFHYHFKTRDAFLRAVMQATYEEMYSRLLLPQSLPREMGSVQLLRLAFRTLGGFARDNRPFIARLFADAMGGEPVAREFITENFPRHIHVIAGLIAAGQKSGELRPIAIAQAIAFCAGAISLPALALGAALEGGVFAKARVRALQDEVLSERALDERIELVLYALSAVPPAADRAPRSKRK